MTVHRVKTCGCGHEESWHKDGTGPCLYGRDHVAGGCSCPSFGKRRRADLAAPPPPPKPAPRPSATDAALDHALGDVIRSLQVLRSELAAPGRMLSIGGKVIGRLAPRGAPPATEASSPPSSEGEPLKTVFDVADEITARAVSKAATAGVGAGERRILSALAAAEWLPRGDLAVRAGYRMAGGFRNLLSTLRMRGAIVDVTSANVAITPEGRRELGTPDDLPRGRALVEFWLRKVKGRCERKIMEELLSVHPRTISQSALAARTGYQVAGGFRNALSSLRGPLLIKGKREIGLSDELARAILT